MFIREVQHKDTLGGVTMKSIIERQDGLQEVMIEIDPMSLGSRFGL